MIINYNHCKDQKPDLTSAAVNRRLLKKIPII